jgi:hypothetical protein
MKTYHRSWLLAHPHRSETWLRARLLDGFDIHHLDGDNANNDPDNLVLIDANDHMRLHDMKMRIVKRVPVRTGGRPTGSFGVKGRLCYEARLTGLRWGEVGALHGIAASSAQDGAKKHATRTGLLWPIPMPERAPPPELPPEDPIKTLDEMTEQERREAWLLANPEFRRSR